MPIYGFDEYKTRVETLTPAEVQATIREAYEQGKYGVNYQGQTINSVLANLGANNNNLNTSLVNLNRRVDGVVAVNESQSRDITNVANTANVARTVTNYLSSAGDNPGLVGNFNVHTMFKYTPLIIGAFYGDVDIVAGGAILTFNLIQSAGDYYWTGLPLRLDPNMVGPYIDLSVTGHTITPDGQVQGVPLVGYLYDASNLQDFKIGLYRCDGLFSCRVKVRITFTISPLNMPNLL